MGRMLSILLAAWWLAVGAVNAMDGGHEFESAAQEQLYAELIFELRCLVCQNQNLADSNAELARDLRARVAEMVRAGKSYQEVVDFMVARYGDFVRYRPPLKASTLLLWAGPFMLLLVVGMAVWLRLRAPPATAAKPFSEQELETARTLTRQAENPDSGTEP